MDGYRTPGVIRVDVFPPTGTALRTGVPAFLGFAQPADPQDDPVQKLTLWSQFVAKFVSVPSDGYLARAVRGFFDNGGQLCYVVRLDDTSERVTALRAGLNTLAGLDTVDLVCAPDIMRLRKPTVGAVAPAPPDPDEVRVMQTALLEHCDTLGDRFALLDALPPPTTSSGVRQQRAALHGTNGALYYPWVWVADDAGLASALAPPCGHIAGVYASTDQRVGVHKAPANEILVGVLDLADQLSDAQQGDLNVGGINCLRAFPGRGIRVWGARTLSSDPAWTYISVRRLFLTAGRWIERNMAGTTFEPHNTQLWARIVRELTAYFTDLLRRGALKGRTAQEAFYIKCDATTNPPEVRDAGQVVTEIGLAPALPSEFVVVRIIHGNGGITITAPTQP